MGSKASKETGTTSCCFGGKKEQELGCSGPLAHWGPDAIATVARMNLLMARLDVDEDELADEGPVHGMFLARCYEAEPQGQTMTLMQHSDPLYPKKRRSDSYFYEGKFLQNDQVREALGERLSCGGGPAGSENPQQSYPNMLEVCSGLEASRFPVIWLKHVTTLDYFRKIVNEGKIRGRDRTFSLKGNPERLGVSCWSPHISRPDVKSFKKWRYKHFMQRFSGHNTIRRQLSPEELEVRDMLANSPALRPDSRYGNFQFTIRLDVLLWSYKEQHCGGYEPVLRVLGTEAYTLEVVHWVLIHSSHLICFDHLPRVDSVWPRSGTGDLMWAPESTTDLYTWFIDPSTGHLRKYPLNSESQQTYGSSRWNNVVFAFYLPEGRTLNLGRGPLLGNVEACEKAQSLWGDSSPVLRHPPDKYIPKEQAEYIIREERVKSSFVW